MIRAALGMAVAIAGCLAGSLVLVMLGFALWLWGEGSD
jgi:hypothetical protein